MTLLPGRVWKYVFSSALVCTAVARPASAELSDSVYADVKDVIEDLLTKEVSESVTPAIACLSGRTRGSDAAARALAGAVKIGDGYVRLEATRHFPHTLQHVFNRQYGTLRSTIKDESASLAGYLVYRALLSARYDGFAAISKSDADKAELIVRTVMDQAAKVADECTSDTQSSSPTCAGMPAVAGAAKSSVSSGIFFSTLSDDQLSECTKAVKQEFAAGAYGRIASYPLDVDCAFGTDAAESVECDVGFAVRAALLEDLSGAEDHLLRTAVRIAAESTNLFRSADVAKKLHLQHELLFLLREAISKVEWTSQLDLRVAALVATYPESKAAFEQLKNLWSFWRSASDAKSGKLNVAAFLNVIMSARGPLLAMCGAQQTPACVVVRKISSPAAGGASAALGKILDDIKPIVEFAGKHRYREVAPMVVRYVFQRAKTTDDEHKEEVQVYQAFAESVATYVLDSADNDPPSEATRQAFRSAAVDMIQYLGRGGGLRRGGSFGRALIFIPYPHRHFWFPDLGMRATWSASYVNRDDSVLRVTPTLPWLNFRGALYRSEASYVGLLFSLVDPMAPLSELALRKTEGVNYVDLGKLGWNFITPRLEVDLGSPVLSEHLAISAGISLRLVAPIERQLRPDEATPSQPTYHYQSFNQDIHGESLSFPNVFGGDSLLPRFLEFGFTAKYVL